MAVAPSENEAGAAQRAAELRRTKLGFGLLAAYGSGALVDSVANAALGTFLMFYLTLVCGLSNSLAGLSLFVGLVIDALADPLVGALSDNTTSKLGRRHPYMLGSALPLALLLAMLFSIPTGLAGWGLFAYVTLVSIGLRVSHSLNNLPYVALGAELSDDYNERTRVVASRFLFSGVGAAAVITLGTRVFMGGPDGLYHRAAYVPFGWTCALLIALRRFIAGFGTLGSTLGRLASGDERASDCIAVPPRSRRGRDLSQSLVPVPVPFVAAGVHRHRRHRRAWPSQHEVLLETAGQRDPACLARVPRWTFLGRHLEPGFHSSLREAVGGDRRPERLRRAAGDLAVAQDRRAAAERRQASVSTPS